MPTRPLTRRERISELRRLSQTLQKCRKDMQKLLPSSGFWEEQSFVLNGVAVELDKAAEYLTTGNPDSMR